MAPATWVLVHARVGVCEGVLDHTEEPQLLPDHERAQTVVLQGREPCHGPSGGHAIGVEGDHQRGRQS